MLCIVIKPLSNVQKARHSSIDGLHLSNLTNQIRPLKNLVKSLKYLRMFPHGAFFSLSNKRQMMGCLYCIFYVCLIAAPKEILRLGISGFFFSSTPPERRRAGLLEYGPKQQHECLFLNYSSAKGTYSGCLLKYIRLLEMPYTEAQKLVVRNNKRWRH
jgi:hypothetical protein